MIAKIKLQGFNFLNQEKGIFMLYDAGEVINLYFTNETPVVFMASVLKDKNKKYLQFLQRFKYIVLKAPL